MQYENVQVSTENQSSYQEPESCQTNKKEQSLDPKTKMTKMLELSEDFKLS